MDPRIIDLYNEELLHLRSEASEFAREYPDRAAALALDENRAEDPYVERLLEGVAFLSARVRLKLDAQYPQFTQQLLDVLFPGWLDPTPSACVLRFRPDTDSSALAEGPVVARGSVVHASIPGQPAVRCEFRTTKDLQLLPVDLASVQYVAARPEDGPSWPGVARAASSLRLEVKLAGECTFADLPLDRLPLYITSPDAYGSQLLELLGGRCTAVAVSADWAPRSPRMWLPGSSVVHVGFDESEAMLPLPSRGHAGFRVLKEYAALPDKFRFVEVTGLRKALAAMRTRTLCLHFHFSGVFPRLESAVKLPSLALSCVPAVNLSERQLDRVDIHPGFTEFHLRADAMRPRDHEVIRVTEVVGGGGGTERPFNPIFEAVGSGRAAMASYYTVRRERRRLTQQELLGRPITYPGSEVYIALSEPAAPPFGRDLQYLSVRALCSNRDMPLYLKAQRSDSRYEAVDTLPVKQIDCMAGPSVPLASPVDGFEPWMALSHLFANYLSLFDASPQKGGEMLRAMLGLYATTTGHFLLRQAEGLNSVVTEQITRRVPGGGPLAFGKGVSVRLDMNDRAFEGGSPFLLAAVLENYLAAHVGINSFVETHLELSDRAEAIAWPPRFGRRPTF
ncbi:MAG: type VI secretion system baseplate subunit TssF [Burkholderiales bacterium]|nr:type VI secretion system baseplate subunit TssF [Burkholderiales bacterium]